MFFNGCLMQSSSFTLVLSSLMSVVSILLVATDLELAKRILASFHMVVITEWMDEPDHLEYFNTALGTTAPVFRKRIFVIDAKKQVKNTDWIDQETLRFVRELNRWDIALYKFAKALTKKRMTMQPSILERKKIDRRPPKCPRSFPEHLLFGPFCPKCMKPRCPQEDIEKAALESGILGRNER